MIFILFNLYLFVMPHQAHGNPKQVSILNRYRTFWKAD